jgi:F-type H+-transporting ATPase subunit b
LSADLPPGGILDFSAGFLVKIGIQWINIAVITFILIKVLYNPVRKFMADRAERIRNELEAANQTSENAVKLKSNYERLIANIETERESLLSQAHHAAVEKSDRIVFSAREEAKHLIIKAREEIASEKENAAEEIKNQIIELSTFMAGRFVEVSIDKPTQDRYVDEALADWSELTWQT